MKISLIIPCYNEEESLAFLFKELDRVIAKANEYEFEMVFVDDGSKDKTLEIIKEHAKEDKRIKYLSFSRNFGQQSALLCGLENSTGDAVIAIDADLQDPPEVALEMIEKWREGYDIVHGKRRKRRGETVFKRATASLFYRFTRKITGLELQRDSGDFKLYDRKVVDVLLKMGEHDRLLRSQVAWIGFKQTCVEFDRPERVAGSTHYTLKKMVRLAEAGVFPNTDYTLTFPIKLGVVFGFLSLACMLTFIILSCCNVWYGGLLAWLFPTVGAFSAIILVCLGVSNIHTSMIYKEVQNRPKYVIAERN